MEAGQEEDTKNLDSWVRGKGDQGPGSDGGEAGAGGGVSLEFQGMGMGNCAFQNSNGLAPSISSLHLGIWLPRPLRPTEVGQISTNSFLRWGWGLGRRWAASTMEETGQAEQGRLEAQTG